MAFRVPTPDVSVDAVATWKTPAKYDELGAAAKEAAAAKPNMAV